jgi:hypothetical protein
MTEDFHKWQTATSIDKLQEPGSYLIIYSDKRNHELNDRSSFLWSPISAKSFVYSRNLSVYLYSYNRKPSWCQAVASRLVINSITDIQSSIHANLNTFFVKEEIGDLLAVID